ncbi:MAG: homoserine dehydrogenase [bacterium]
MKEIGIGLLGFGTVGAGVVEALQRNGDLLAGRVGVKLVMRRIADVDLERDRGVKVDRAIMTRDAAAVIDDPAVDVVIELIGGTTIARDFMMRALRLGKPVVTANKALLAEYGQELFALAAEKHTGIWYEASVAGGVPIIRALQEGLVANRIERICGILNGTCNYILTQMEREQMTFDHALKEAQAAGFAEADPGLDIDGFDTAHKAAILAMLAYGVHVPKDKVFVDGIRGLSKTDIEHASEFGYRIKQLAVIKLSGGEVEVRVHPTLIPHEHMLASVMGVYNAVVVDGDIVGQTVYYGRGAGRLPTASAVVSDLADVARMLVDGGRKVRATPLTPAGQVKFRPMADVESRYYLRLSLLDKPGVLGLVASVLGQHGISLASIVQKEPNRSGKHVSVVLLTHKAVEKNVMEALRALEERNALGAKPVCMRIEDPGIEK